jgi:hypothetical protein
MPIVENTVVPVSLPKSVTLNSHPLASGPKVQRQGGRQREAIPDDPTSLGLGTFQVTPSGYQGAGNLPTRT